MQNNFLITGYWGEPHVTAENDRGINAATFGKGRFVLPVGEQFRAEYIGNNTIRMYDGKLMNNGAAAGIPAGEYVDLLVAEAGQGKKRNDLIIFQYSQDASTLVESGTFVVIQGVETSGTPSDPTLTQKDLLSGEATFDQMALWRVSVSGTVISAPVKLFTVSNTIADAKTAADNAQKAADNAQTSANGAQTTANQAKTAAGNAQTAADNAQSTANGAQTAAQNAQGTANSALTAAQNAQNTADGKAPAYTYGMTDLTAGSSALETGKLYFVYE